MPGFSDGSVFFGLIGGFLAIIVAHGRGSISFRRVLLVALASAYVLPHLLAWIQPYWRALPWLPEITGGMAFLGAWFALAALTLFERKGQPRRVPIWAGLLFATGMAFAVPVLLDSLTGAYQRPSLRADVNGCVRYTPGAEDNLDATNLCDYEIVVGLCLPGEENPSPCTQSVTLATGGTASLDRAATQQSSVPGHPNGYTLVACRPPHRPSRMTHTTGRGYDGVCLPGD